MRFERTGLVLSLGVHVGLASLVVLGLPDWFEREEPPADYVIVDYVEVAEESAQDEETPPPEPEPEKTQPQLQPEPVIEEVPETVPEPEVTPKPEQKPEPAPQDNAEPPQRQPRTDIVPRTKPRPPSRLDTSRLAALIDREVEKSAPEVPDTNNQEIMEEAVQRFSALDLRSAQEVASLKDVLRARLQNCWNIPSGGAGVDSMRVEIRISLRPDGRLSRPPQYLGVGDLNAPGREFFRTFAESARRAVQQCAPYADLPAEKYDLWKEIDFTFDARDMFG